MVWAVGVLGYVGGVGFRLSFKPGGRRAGLVEVLSMKVRCQCCGQVIQVSVYWTHFRCLECGYEHARLDNAPRWQYARGPEDWLCWECGFYFEVWKTLHGQADCPRCGCHNLRDDSLVMPLVQRQEVLR